jgi:hypothetical protein
MSGAQVVGWWFNPRNGTAQSAGEFPTNKSVQLDPPGEGDWALVIDDAAQALPAPSASFL